MFDLSYTGLIEAGRSRDIGDSSVGGRTKIRERGRRDRKVDREATALERRLGIVSKDDILRAFAGTKRLSDVLMSRPFERTCEMQV